MTSALLRSQRRNAIILGCWGRRVRSDVCICTMLLGCLTDEVSTVVEPKTQCHDIRLLRPTCWVGWVYMCRSKIMNCLESGWRYANCWIEFNVVGLLELGWHNEWGQHRWVTKCGNAMVMGCWQKMDQYVESSFVDLLQRKDVGLLELGWHNERGQYRWVAKCSNTMVMGYWQKKRGTNVLDHLLLIDCNFKMLSC